MWELKKLLYADNPMNSLVKCENFYFPIFIFLYTFNSRENMIYSRHATPHPRYWKEQI